MLTYRSSSPRASIRYTHKDLFYVARSRIGSWEKAVESAGIKYNSVRRARDWTKQAVINRILELHKQGADLRAGAIQKSEIPLSGAVQRYFRTLRKAMKAAGLPYPDPRTQALSHWTESLVVQTLQELHGVGYDLRYGNVKARKTLLFYAAKKLFGSYPKAVEQAGINYWEMSQMHLRRQRRR